MNVGTIVFVVTVLLVITATAVLVARRPRRGVELEPPARPPARPTVREPEAPAPPDEATVAEIEDALIEVARPTFRDRLAKARSVFAGSIGSILSRSKIDQETWDDLEEALIRADVGVGPTTELLDAVRARVKEEGITSPEQLLERLKDEVKSRLEPGDRSLRFEPGSPNVWLFVGVNGVGKTTTIGKVGKQQIEAGRTVVMAAGDTFRAAAAEQLELWATRVGAQLVRGNEGGDPSSVIFDAVQRAGAKGYDLVLADTAGRLHTKSNLMEELSKVRRVADKDPGKVTEVLLVLDATTGQNGLVQAQQFTEAVEVTGIVLTKLDGSAKGGIVLAIQSQLAIPVKLVGLGETADDLVPFDPDEFVEALLAV
ncbi:MAG: fused signal recognition particle receptor [Acidimicrobiaceae bacterium]